LTGVTVWSGRLNRISLNAAESRRRRRSHDAVGARDLTDGTRDDDHHRVTRALAETPEFCQPYGPGIWALPEEARKRLPLLGRWAAKELRSGDLVTFFESVGAAFADARGELSVEAVVAQPDIRKALADMAKRTHEAKGRACEEIRREVISELGACDEYLVTLAAYDREQTDLPTALYLLFEAGDVGLHRNAPPAFYRGAAALFGVDAARLSRT
jgi:hypothetical protein